jgi:hypothetical protein
MRKLTLDPEALRVDSFDTGEEGGAGTVLGNLGEDVAEPAPEPYPYPSPYSQNLTDCTSACRTCVAACPSFITQCYTGNAPECCT